MIKVCTILGTRPEIIRLSRIIKEFDKFFDHVLINTNQNFTYDLNKIFFESLDIRKPNVQFNINVDNGVIPLGNMLNQAELVLLKEKPDAIFILGDTDSSLCSIIAKRLKIPIFHFEAGNRCFDEIVPEEINRKIIDSISNINFTYSTFSRMNLINEGKSVEDVICVGSPMREVLVSYWQDIINSNILKKLELDSFGYMLISIHRQETVNNKKKLKLLLSNIKHWSEDLEVTFLWPLHPRTEDMIKKYGFDLPKSITIIKPQTFQDYIALQRNAELILSDSGTIAEETSLLGLRSLNIREQFERQETQETELIPLVGLDRVKWKTAYELIKQQQLKSYPESPISEYNRLNVSQSIISNIITSLTRFKIDI